MKNVLVLFAAGALATAVCIAYPVMGEEKKPAYELRSSWECGQFSRVDVTLEVGGELKVLRDNKVIPIKMSVVGKLGYDEKLLQLPAVADRTLRSVRHYDTAAATLKIGEGGAKPLLRDDRRLIGVKIDEGAATLFSPAGSLTREELDLIDMPGNSLLLDRLLPERAVAPGDTWKHSDALSAVLLGLDKVRGSNVQSTLTTVTDGMARIQIAGRVEGSIAGASTEVELKGKYQFSLAAKRVIWFGLLLRESRKIGEAAPGTDVVARLQMQISPLAGSGRLTDAALEGLSLTPTSTQSQLSHRSGDGMWQFSHDRTWYVTADEHDLTVLRLVDQGERLAQCNVSSLPKSDATKQVKLADFQEDVRQALDKSFGQFVEAAQWANAANYRVYRVVVRGVVSDLPIQWNYYLIADEQGRQVVLTFTIEESLASRFDDADRKLVSTLRFLDPKVTAKPALAPQQDSSRR